MAVTPQTNTTLNEIAEALLKHDRICICGHVSPDGDCIGSQLALRCALAQLGKEVVVLLASADKLSVSFEFLPGFEELIPAASFEGTCDVFVQVDVPNARRLGEDASKIRQSASLTITIDHHAVDERETHLSYTDPDAASTSMLVWETVKHLGVDLTKDIATCAYTGLMTDTGRFQYQNADLRAFRAACEMVEAGADPAFISAEFFQRATLASIQLEAAAINNMRFICDGCVALSFITQDEMKRAGAVKSDCEQLINTLRSIDGVKVAAMLRDEGKQVRGSFRSKDTTDVSAIAKRFGGGGHKAAAGFTLYEPLDKAVRMVEKALCQVFREGNN
ncbi:bifunctional oligoribonuclease/PAP phosphatase NrnA [Adlercreutzia sp. ZJ154]|uniref:DHH family phosphoesterase n=1 Tax=Adlercreutzia sp. ZJ154 TaxID=2709790 RepID=UPI0013EA85D4|nr:bifunctional oligoribonuclease/PAP phosphatase NrnA [Adlercreutzia sp. ZJ154]